MESIRMSDCSTLADTSSIIRFDRQGSYSNPWKFTGRESKCRLACLEFENQNGKNTARAKHFQDVASLRDYLEKPDRALSHTGPSRRLFLLEGTNNAFRDPLSLALNINAQFWARHAWVTKWDRTWKPTRDIEQVPVLPSLANADQSFFLECCHLMELNLDQQRFDLRCVENGRHISSSRTDGKFDDVGAINHRLSFWAKRCGEEGWDALMVLDEPFTQAVCRTDGVVHVVKAVKAPQPLSGGYRDFMESSQSRKESMGPPRTSMFDDLLFYHTQYARDLYITKNPSCATWFAQRIIASEYMLVAQYYAGLLNSIAWRLSRRDSFDVFNSLWVEQAWSDLNSFHRRLDLHKQSIARAMDALEIRTPRMSPETMVWMIANQDFRHIEAEMLRLRDKAQGLLTFFDSLAGIVGHRQSLKEARSVKGLTRLGMVFLPLSLVASLFSMSGEFKPGARQFWLYFAVSIPAVITTFVIAWLVSYGPRSARSSLEAFLVGRKRRPQGQGGSIV